MINFATSDSVIWNRDRFIIDVIEQMVKREPMILDTAGEGPCAASLGLYDLLDELCRRFQYPKQRITLRTCNLVEQHPDYNVNIVPQMFYLKAALQYPALPAEKDFSNIKHFGHFVGHGNRHRLRMASEIYRHCQDQCVQTYHCRTTDSYHRSFIGLEDMMFDGATPEQIDAAITLINGAPITQDSIDQYPILSPTTLNITKLYPNFLVEIVNLTYWSGNTFYLDEKIWRPVLMKTPFIVQGPQDFIPRLQSLGFRTFHDYWDEGYSQDPAPCHTNAMCQIVRELATKTTADLEYMYNDMMPILQHNYDLLRTITPAKLAAVCRS